MSLKKTVVLVGMMGAGKTAVGKSLAARLGVAFKDSDAEIVDAANMSIAEIFERDGEPFFRSAETRVLERLLQTEPCVLSTGGGAFMREENRALIAKLGVSVCLDADLALLWDRVKGKNTRPLLQTDDPFQTLSDIYNQRQPVYAQATIVVKTLPQNTIEDTSSSVFDALKSLGDDVVLQDERQADD